MAHHWFNLHSEFITSEAFRRSCNVVSNSGSSDSSLSASSASSVRPELIILRQQRCYQQELNSNGCFMPTQGNPMVAHLNTRASLNQFSYPPPVPQIVNGASLQSLKNSQVVAASSVSQQQPQVQQLYNFSATTSYHQYPLNDAPTIYQQQIQHPNTAQVIPNLTHQSAFISASHLSTVPPLLHISASMAQNQMGYANAHPHSTSQLMHNNIPLHYHYSAQHQLSIAENGTRLHISHSAPNLQKNGSFTHPPPSIPTLNLPQLPIAYPYQLQPHLQNTLHQQTTQNVQSNCNKINSLQNHLPVPISMF